MSSCRSFSTITLTAILLASQPFSLLAFEDTPAAREVLQRESSAQQARLLPLLIDQRELAQLRRRLATPFAQRQAAQGDGSPQPVSRPFLADLDLVYALDISEPAPLLSEGMLAAWGIDRDTAQARALANLRANFGGIHHKPVARLPWLHVIDSDDGYAASRLLLLDKWSAIAIELGEPLIVGVPTRDVVVFTASRDPQQLQQLRDTVETLAQHQERPVSRQLFVWHPDGWSLLE
jgi:hypothetical protein